MAYIKVLKDNELIGGTDNTDVYPVTTTQAIFSQKDNGEVRLGEDGKPEKLEDRLAEIEFQIELIKNGGLFIDMVLDPKSIVVGDTTDVLVKVHSSGVVSSITVYENGVSLGTEENVTDWVRTISVTPATMGDIVYEAHIVVNEGDNPIVKRSTLTVTKKQSAISWSKEIATVTMIQDYRVLPTLDTGGLVGTFTYSSSDPSVADFSNNQEYQSINFYKSNPYNPITIRVDYVDPNHVHQSTSASYSLTINKAIADVSWDVGDTFEYFTSATEPVELYITKNSPVPLTLVYESTDSRVVIDDQQDWVRLPITTIEDSGDYEDFTVTAKIKNDIYYEDLVLPCSIRLKKVEPSFTWDRSSASITIGDTPYTFPVLTNIPNDVIVMYRSTNTNVAPINNSTGVIDVEHLGAGSATIVAYNDSTTKYKEHSVSYSLIVQEQQAEFYWEVDTGNGFNRVESSYTLTYTVTTETLPKIRFHAEGDYDRITISNLDIYETTPIVENVIITLPDRTDAVGKYKLVQLAANVVKNSKSIAKAYLNIEAYKETVRYTGISGVNPMEVTPDAPFNSQNPYFIPNTPKVTGIAGTPLEGTLRYEQYLSDSYITVNELTGDVYAIQSTNNAQERGIPVVPAGYACVVCYTMKSDQYFIQSTLGKPYYFKIKINPYATATPDYYIGWTNGTRDAFGELSEANIIALAGDGYNSSVKPTYERAMGSTNIFFLLYSSNKLPRRISLINEAQGTEQTLNLVTSNNCPHDSVTIGGNIFNVFGFWVSSYFMNPEEKIKVEY